MASSNTIILTYPEVVGGSQQDGLTLAGCFGNLGLDWRKERKGPLSPHSLVEELAQVSQFLGAGGNQAVCFLSSSRLT